MNVHLIKLINCASFWFKCNSQQAKIVPKRDLLIKVQSFQLSRLKEQNKPSPLNTNKTVTTAAALMKHGTLWLTLERGPQANKGLAHGGQAIHPGPWREVIGQGFKPDQKPKAKVQSHRSET